MHPGAGVRPEVPQRLLRELFDDDDPASSDDWQIARDHQTSVQRDQDRRLEAFCKQMQRIREEAHIDDEAGNPDSHRGSPRPVRDLDDLHPKNGEPKFYPKIMWAAHAIGVGRAHNVINAMARNGRCAGHRFVTDEFYWRSYMSLQKRLESRIEKAETELRRMKELNKFLTDPKLSELLIDLEQEAAKLKPSKPEKRGAAKPHAKSEENQTVTP